MTQADASFDASSEANLLAATCGTCAWRDEQGVCREHRSARVDWHVDAGHFGCYFYNRKPALSRIGEALEEPPEEEEQSNA